MGDCNCLCYRLVVHMHCQGASCYVRNASHTCAPYLTLCAPNSCTKTSAVTCSLHKIAWQIDW